MKKVLFPVILIIALVVGVTCANAEFTARIKDIASIEGVRENQLIGYGIVVGLNGTGDKSSSVFSSYPAS